MNHQQTARGERRRLVSQSSLLNASTNYVRILSFNDAPCMAGDENAYVKLFSVDKTHYVSM